MLMNQTWNVFEQRFSFDEKTEQFSLALCSETWFSGSAILKSSLWAIWSLGASVLPSQGWRSPRDIGASTTQPWQSSPFLLLLPTA